MRYTIIDKDYSFLNKLNAKTIREVVGAVFFKRGVSYKQVEQLMEIFGVTRTHFYWEERTPLVVYPDGKHIPIDNVASVVSLQFYVHVDNQAGVVADTQHSNNSKTFIARTKTLMKQLNGKLEGDAIIFDDGGGVTLDDLVDATPAYTDILRLKVNTNGVEFAHTGAIEDVINMVPHVYRDILVQYSKSVGSRVNGGSFREGDNFYVWEFL